MALIAGRATEEDRGKCEKSSFDIVVSNSNVGASGMVVWVSVHVCVCVCASSRSMNVVVREHMKWLALWQI